MGGIADVIPPDNRAPGATGHIADHNDISDVLEALQNQVNAFLVAGLATTGSVDISQPGQGLRIAEGANARQGTVTLAGGTATVANTSVTAQTRIWLTAQQTAGVPGALGVSARTAGSSFTVTSSSGGDSSLVAWLLTEPG